MSLVSSVTCIPKCVPLRVAGLGVCYQLMVVPRSCRLPMSKYGPRGPRRYRVYRACQVYLSWHDLIPDEDVPLDNDDILSGGGLTNEQSSSR